MFKVCLENRIVRRERDYKCFLCHCEDIDHNYEAIKEHLKQWRHKKLLKEMDQFERKKELDVIDSISETQRKILVENHIAIANRKNERYRCYMCSSYLSSLTVVFDHMQTFIHKTNYKKKFSSTLTAKNNDGALVVGRAHVWQPFFFEKEYWCQICQVGLKKFALIKCHSMAHFFQKHKVQQDDAIYFHYQENNVVKITCLLCEKSLDTIESLEHHLSAGDHQSRINLLSSEEIKSETMLDISEYTIAGTSSHCEDFKEYVTVVKVFCKVCSEVIPVADFEKHTHSKEHYDKAVLQILEGGYKSLKDPKPKAKLDTSNNYMCFVCNRSFDTIINLLKHYESIQHKKKIAALYVFLNKRQSVQQGNMVEHKKKSKTITMNINDKDLACLSQNLNKQLKLEKTNYSTSNKITPLKNSMQTKLTEANSSETSKLNSLLPRNRKPRKPKVNKKIITQSDKNLAIFGNTYVNMCIEPGDRNIYDISEKMSRLLNLSTKLIVPTDSGWICIPCADTITNDEFLIYEHLNDSKHAINVNKLEADNQPFVDYPDQFSDLKLAKAHMQEESDSYVYCYACDTKVSNFDNSISQHLVTNKHILKSKSLDIELKEMSKVLLAITKSFWYYAHFFICEICTLSFDIELEFIIHLKSKEHLHNANKIKLKNIATKFHTCPTCVTCWYGASVAYSNHIKGSLHKRLMDSSEFMVPPISMLTNGLLNEPQRNIEYLICESDKTNTQEAQDQELFLLGTIELTVESKYPMARAYVFGSRLSYLGFPNSDFNVYLDCEDVYYKNISEEKREQYLTTVKSIFENQSHNWIVEDTVLNQRVPSIKVRNVNSNEICDISFKSGLDVEKSKLVRDFNIAFPLCRELILYLKKWLDLCRLTEANSMTTYTISWFVIFFLQIKGILPSVHQLVKMKNKSTLVDGWECGFEESIPAAITNLPLKVLVKEFFLYYANFDYKSNVICPYLGTTIKKSCFANIEQLPEQMKVYQNRIIKGEVEFFRLDSPMCIQDPIEHSHNITKPVTKLQLQYFMQYCAESSEKVNC